MICKYIFFDLEGFVAMDDLYNILGGCLKQLRITDLIHTS